MNPRNNARSNIPGRIPLLPDPPGSWAAKTILIRFDALKFKSVIIYSSVEYETMKTLIVSFYGCHGIYYDVQMSGSSFQKKWSVHEGVKMMVASTLLSGQATQPKTSSPPKLTAIENTENSNSSKSVARTNALATSTPSTTFQRSGRIEISVSFLAKYFFLWDSIDLIDFPFFFYQLCSNFNFRKQIEFCCFF